MELTKTRHTSSTIFAGVIGDVIEWYDFALFGYFAPVISRLFFPSEDALTSLIATYAVFAGGFAMRPVGAVLFGYIGDKGSRRRALLLSVVLMTVPTFLLGLLPTHAQVGAVAAVLLTVIRLVQGLSVGGEFTGSVTYVVETSPERSRGITGSWANVGSMSGMLLGAGAAAAVTTLLPDTATHTWGWRVPFLIGGIIGVLALLLRSNLSSPQLLEEHDSCHRSPLVEALHCNIRESVQGVLFTAGYGVLFYIAIVYLPTYVSEFGDHSADHALQANTISTLGLLLLIPLMGLASDHLLRRKHILILAFLIGGASSWGLLHLALAANFSGILASQLIFVIIIAAPLGIAPAMLVELFPTEDRLTGYSLAYNLGLGLVGGTTPMISTWLISVTENIFAPAFYLAGLCLIGVMALVEMGDRSREPLEWREPGRYPALGVSN